VNRSRAAARQAIADLADATVELRRHLEINEGLLALALESIDDGMTIKETIAAVPSIKERRAAEENMQHLYSVRREVRKTVIAAAIDEGMTVPEIATSYGIPVDRVADYIAAVADFRGD